MSRTLAERVRALLSTRRVPESTRKAWEKVVEWNERDARRRRRDEERAERIMDRATLPGDGTIMACRAKAAALQEIVDDPEAIPELREHAWQAQNYWLDLAAATEDVQRRWSMREAELMKYLPYREAFSDDAWSLVERWRAIRASRKLAEEAVPGESPWLASRGHPDHQALIRDGDLVVPVHADDRGEERMVGVQLINPSGESRFPADVRIGYGRHRIGRGSEVWLCEDYVSALSVHAALRRLHRTGEAWATFSPRNLLAVGSTLARRPRVYVVADRDPYHCSCGHRWFGPRLCPKCGRTGTDGHGERAAKRLRRPYWLPPGPGTANDLHVEKGLEALVESLRKWIVDRRIR